MPAITKLANVLVEDASSPLEAVPGFKREMDRWRRRDGGLWVGGRVTLSDTELVFTANAANRAVQNGTMDVTVDLRQIQDVRFTKALGMNIVDVGWPSGRLRIRCYGAKRFAAAVEAARR